MNYLAHIRLSHNQPEILLGNFLGDLIGNRDLGSLTDEMRRGVELHRKIDVFTDSHPIVEEAVNLLQPYHRKYSPVVVDILYDYLLSQNWNEFTETPLQEYSNDAYAIILKHLDYVPDRRRNQVETMVAHNWLMGYGQLEHLHGTFMRVKQRAKFPSQFEWATKHLEENYAALNEGFRQFFPELLAMSYEFVAKA